MLRIPERVAQRPQVVTAHGLGECVGGRILKVVGLVEDQPLGVLGPLVVADDEGVVEHGYMTIAQPVAGSTMEVQFVESGHRRCGRILSLQHAAKTAQCGAPRVKGSSPQIVPVPRRRLGHPAEHHGQRERLVWAEPIRVLGQSVQLSGQGLQVDVVAAALQQHRLERLQLVGQLLESGHDLVLQHLGVGGNDHGAAAGPGVLDGWQQVGESLASAGRRLDQPSASGAQRVCDLTGHFHLLATGSAGSAHQGPALVEHGGNGLRVELTGGRMAPGPVGHRHGLLQRDRLRR